MIERKVAPKKNSSVEVLPLPKCIAKTVITDNDITIAGVNVETHCKIVGMVARELIFRFPENLQNSLFPPGAELVAAVHDIGKVNPLFQEKIHRTLTAYDNNSRVGLKNANPDLEKLTGWHSGVSQAALLEVGHYIPEIVGGHHGYSSSSSILLPNDSIIGGVEWQKERMRLLDNLKLYFNVGFPIIKSNSQAFAIAGLTTVSDWIGSGTVFENLTQNDLFEIESLAKIAVDCAGLIPPKLNKGLQFEEIFRPYKPRPMQKALIEMIDLPGVYILEALMGEGKTEAALQSAYKLIDSGLANGIYFALPTQLTSEKIYERMNQFLNKILAPDDLHRSHLLHSNAWLYETDFGKEGRPGFSWFDSRKRGLLAPFAVGTIDQALMSVLNVKHGFVRAFGLAGKVVILDEVHSYDCYTGSIMDYLVKRLVELGSTVILLSATLVTDRKEEMIGVEDIISKQHFPMHYPLITKSVRDSAFEVSAPIEVQSNKVNILHIQDDDKALGIVMKKIIQGQLVLWIENTVQEAQKVFKKFAAWGAINSIEVGLLHSRFPTFTRSILDTYWVNIFGKEGFEKRKSKGRLLVGTQVLEQSLDLDADFLVTRLAPTDMLLQRIGRLWRHHAIYTNRPINAKREVMILAPPLERVKKNPLWEFGVSGKVYAPYVLVRTLQVWITRNNISIPNDMRSLIESTYEERKETGSIAKVKEDLLLNNIKLKTFANNSMSLVGSSQSDNAFTRYSEIITCDVLLLQKEPDLEKNLFTLHDGEEIVLPTRNNADLTARKKAAALLMKYLIRVPNYLAPAAVSTQELKWLRGVLYISENEDERIRVAILEPSGKISGLKGRISNEKYKLEYLPILGYSATKKEDA